MKPHQLKVKVGHGVRGALGPGVNLRSRQRLPAAFLVIRPQLPRQSACRELATVRKIQTNINRMPFSPAKSLTCPNHVIAGGLRLAEIDDRNLKQQN
jgi:hypothetical protein